MLKLDIKTELYWLDLPGKVKVRVKPVSTAIMSAAWSATYDEHRKQIESGMLNPHDEAMRRGVIDSLLITSLARIAITEWEGVYLADGLTLAPINEQTVADLMAIWVVGREFLDSYTRQMKLLEIEGNVSAPAASGTSAAEAPIAASAT